MENINSGRENEGQMFDIIRTGEGEVPGGEQEDNEKKIFSSPISSNPNSI